jgi:hypothetical protein
MVEYIGKKGFKCQHSVSSLSFVLLVPTFLVDSSTKSQEKMPLALIKKTAAYAVLPDISIYIIYTNNPVLPLVFS